MVVPEALPHEPLENGWGIRDTKCYVNPLIEYRRCYKYYLMTTFWYQEVDVKPFLDLEC